MRSAALRAVLSLAFFATQAQAITSWPSGPLVECPFHSQESLEGCTSTFQWNTDEICGERGSWLPFALSEWLGGRAGWDRLTLNNLAQLYRWTGNSFTDDALKFIGAAESWRWEDFWKWVAQSWRKLTVYTLAGVIPLIIGVLVLLSLLFIVIPALVIGTCRRQKKEKVMQPKPPIPPRSLLKYSVLHGVIIVTVLVCIISMLHNINSVYYAIAPARCVGADLSEEFLIGSLRTSSGHEFAGVTTALIALKQANTTVERLESEVQGPISLKNRTVVGLKSLYAPLLWTDSLLRAPSYYLGWADVTGLRSVPFSLNMMIPGASDLSAAIQFDSLSGDYGALIAAAEATGSSGSVNPSPELLSAVTAARRVITDLSKNVIEALPSLSDAYHYLKETINAVTEWAERNLRSAYWNLVLFSAVPILGIVMALLISSSWRYRNELIRVGRGVRPSRLAQLGSGYLIFGLIFWGGILFLIGGGVLVISYFTSDACLFIEKDLFTTGRYPSYQIFDSIPKEIVNACLTKSSSGNLIEQYGNLNISDLDKFLTASQVIDPSLITDVSIPHPAANAFISKHGVPTLVLPIDHQALPSSDIRIKWSSLSQMPVQTLSADAMSLVTSAVPNATLPIYGLVDVTEALNDYLREADCSQHFLCLGSKCPRYAVKVTMQSIYRYDLADLMTALQRQNWQSVVTSMGASYRMRRVLQCVAESTRMSEARKAEFYGGVWIAAQKAAAMSPLLRVSGSLADPTVVDICPVAEACPVFYHTSLVEDTRPQIDLIDHEVWESLAALDIAETLSTTSATKLVDLVVDSAVTYNLGTMSAKGLESINRHLNCIAVFDSIEKFEASICNGPLSDIAAWGVATLIVATMHILGAILIWPYWRSQRQLPKGMESIDSDPFKLTPRMENSAECAHLPSNLPRAMRIAPEEFLYASEMGLTHRVQACLEQFPPNSVQDIYYSNTPLHLACYYGHLDCASKILEASWFVDPLNFKGNTPLMAVTCNISMSLPQKLQICKLLLDRGANPRIQNGEQESPMSAAQKMPDCEELLALMQLYDREAPTSQERAPISIPQVPTGQERAPISIPQ